MHALLKALVTWYMGALATGGYPFIGLLKGSLHRITLWLAGILVALGILCYFLVHRQMKDKPAPKQAP